MSLQCPGALLLLQVPKGLKKRPKLKDCNMHAATVACAALLGHGAHTSSRSFFSHACTRTRACLSSRASLFSRVTASCVHAWNGCRGACVLGVAGFSMRDAAAIVAQQQQLRSCRKALALINCISHPKHTTHAEKLLVRSKPCFVVVHGCWLHPLEFMLLKKALYMTI